MSNPERFPGSREEDAWLSDEQLERCAPAETEPFQGPVPTRMISNGEYMPHPQTEKQRHVEARVKELADKASKKLGISRRQFLESAGGLAASFLAINEVFGQQLLQSATGRDVRAGSGRGEWPAKEPFRIRRSDAHRALEHQ